MGKTTTSQDGGTATKHIEGETLSKIGKRRGVSLAIGSAGALGEGVGGFCGITAPVREEDVAYKGGC